MFPTELFRFQRSICDPIHGTISLSNEEVAVIDHRLFRRLHRIRQNGLLYLVFPAATHTRFEHSLGVLHLADEAFWYLLQNSYTGLSKKSVAEINDAEIGEAVAFHKIDAKILADFRRVLRFAALVHDLGHGPFSHTFDSFAPKSAHLGTVLQKEESLSNIRPLIDAIASIDGRVDHEQMSCVFFTRIWNELPNKQDGFTFRADELPLLVSAAVLGEPGFVGNCKLEPFLSLLHDCLASAPVDCDRMDYLERDSRSIGVTYGLFSRERILKSLLCYKGTNDSRHQYRLGIKLSGIRAVENFIQARFELFVQVYYHKTNRATELMLEKIAETAAGNDIDVFQPATFDELVERYTKLSDESFLRMLCEEVENSEIKSIANRITNRDLWKRVWEGSRDIADEVLKRLRQIEPVHIFIDKIDPKATKGLEGGAYLLQRKGSDTYKAQDKADWLDRSPMIKALAKQEGEITRIYYTGVDGDTLEKLRSAAREYTPT